MKKFNAKLIAFLLVIVMVMAAVPVMAEEESSSGVGGVVTSISYGKTTATYTGEKMLLGVTAYNAEGKEIDPMLYAVSGNRTTRAGAGEYTLRVKVVGIGSVTGEINENVKFTIAPAKKTINVSINSKKVSYKKVKKSAQYTSAVSVKGIEDRTLSMKKMSGNKNITVSGMKFKVKKGTKKGRYNIKIRVYAKNGKNFKDSYQTKTVSVIVK